MIPQQNNRRSQVDKILQQRKKKMQKSEQKQETNVTQQNTTETQVKDKGETKKTMSKEKKVYEFKTIKLDDMLEYIDSLEKKDEALEEFKKECFVMRYNKKTGKNYKQYNHFVARDYFVKKYMPEIMPEKKIRKDPVSKKLGLN